MAIKIINKTSGGGGGGSTETVLKIEAEDDIEVLNETANLAKVAGYEVDLEANTLYRIEITMIGDNNGQNIGIVFGLEWDQVEDYLQWSHIGQVETNWQEATYTNSNITPVVNESGIIGANGSIGLVYHGFVETGANGANVYFGLNQKTADAVNPVIIRQGSHAIFTKIDRA